MRMKRIFNQFILNADLPSGRDGSAGADGGRADFRAHRARLQWTSDLRPPTSDLRPPSRYAAKSGFSLIEVMVSAVLAIIVVWTAGTQIINVLRYHNEYRIDAILLEDLTRVANGVQSRIEMCTSWTNNSGVWEGTFPIQVNGVAFETNRFTNVKQYQVAATNGAFVETLIRNPKEGWRTNTVTRFVANEPGFLSASSSVEFSEIRKITLPPSPAEATPTNKVYRAEFSASAEWRWAGRTYTNSVTVPRMIVLYNRN
jgi:hypothetical protein